MHGQLDVLDDLAGLRASARGVCRSRFARLVAELLDELAERLVRRRLGLIPGVRLDEGEHAAAAAGLRSLSRACGRGCRRSWRHRGRHGSCSTSAISATSSTERPYTPTVSSDRRLRQHAGARDGAEGRLEAVHAAEGGRTDHRALGLRADAPAAPFRQPTAAAEPADEPPGVCSGLCGLRVLLGVRWQARS